MIWIQFVCSLAIVAINIRSKCLRGNEYYINIATRKKMIRGVHPSLRLCRLKDKVSVGGIVWRLLVQCLVCV